MASVLIPSFQSLLRPRRGWCQLCISLTVHYFLSFFFGSSPSIFWLLLTSNCSLLPYLKTLKNKYYYQNDKKTPTVSHSLWIVSASFSFSLLSGQQRAQGYLVSHEACLVCRQYTGRKWVRSQTATTLAFPFPRVHTDNTPVTSLDFDQPSPLPLLHNQHIWIPNLISEQRLETLVIPSSSGTVLLCFNSALQAMVYRNWNIQFGRFSKFNLKLLRLLVNVCDST